ncbi:ATP-binding protein [Rhodoferax sp.]|uniref:ATP-binding protein n=1 Tax=Rhodoferax sp. TaxID=50421 RepID=UPI00344C436C
MFEPVASTKTGAHRGLGLSVVNELVKKMNGQIRYLSSPKGVRFEVLLPAAER